MADESADITPDISKDDLEELDADVDVDPVGDPYFDFGMPISREAWDAYGLDEVLETPARDESRQQLALYRRMAYRIHEVRSAKGEPEDYIKPGHLLAFGLLDEVLRYVFALYAGEQAPEAIDAARRHLDEQGRTEALNETLTQFVAQYPPAEVRTGAKTPAEYLAEAEGGQQHGDVALREMALLKLASENRALKPFRILFDDAELAKKTDYEGIVTEAAEVVDAQAPVEVLDLPLFRCLRAPMEASPDSLEGQLDYIREHWARLLPKRLLRRMTFARDTLREETQARGFGKGAVDVLEPGRGLSAGYDEPERFSADVDWMANVVLIAKITHVWLDQLSRWYNRPIRRLDEVPDEELDRLARYGVTGLWLIGIWERSVASEWIKKRMGNPEAAASAYSLYDYDVANDLGGEEAYFRLKDRAWQRGIRLATDMVPNHVGVHSKWVAEHPDWFLQMPHPPYPSYDYTGPDLCPDERVGVHIEDGYWSHGDAAVTFQRTDYWTGDKRYIYHGNDGTSMPWNDTAQLDYLNPEVREAVIQTILHVARLSPIIRFDAAMTLAKKHYQRLWFPQPGEGGAIPSRSEFSMTREEFDRHMPEEFWREVVDRVQAEQPDTLLLAEAFWLMEGYFVRTLGMHRVYNSAFMNMLKMEENLKYRMTIKNVLGFSPEVLKRFVNFMNNPDELTADEQFGRGDKYMGCCMLMATMPGLPMLGHGQIEGFREKYGMEYRRAYWDEAVDEDLVRRHEQYIFPLLRKRWLFSGSDNFAFFDFIHPEEYVDENVFAYTNHVGGERALVLFNNAYQSTRGHIHSSTAINAGSADAPNIIHRTLAQALDLQSGEGVYYIFRDQRTGLQYIREGRELVEEGLYAELSGYQYHVFLEWEEVRDVHHVWHQVARELSGRGVSDIHRTYRQVVVAPMLEAFSSVVSPRMLRMLSEGRRDAKAAEQSRKRLDKVLGLFLDIVEAELGLDMDKAEIREAVGAEIKALQGFDETLLKVDRRKTSRRQILSFLPSEPADGAAFWRIPIVWALLHHLEEVLGVHWASDRSAAWVDEWLLTLPISESFVVLGETEAQAEQDVHLLMVLTRHTPGLMGVDDEDPQHLIEEMLEDPVATKFLGVHQYQGVRYCNKEQLERALSWTLFTSALMTLGDEELTPAQRASIVESRLQIVSRILDAAKEAGYAVKAAIDLLEADRKKARALKAKRKPEPK